jgi:hypothetical protein
MTHDITHECECTPLDCLCSHFDDPGQEIAPPMIAVLMPLDLAEGLWHELQERAENLDDYVISLVRGGGDSGAIFKAQDDHEMIQAAADCLHDALEGDCDVLDTIEPVDTACECSADAFASIADSFAKLADAHIALLERVGGAG